MLKRNPWPVILQVIPELDTGGAELTVIEMAEAISKGGGLPLVASRGGRMESRLMQVGGELVRMAADSKNPAVMLANAQKLTKIIRARGVSIVHARSRAPAWSCYLATRRTRRCFVTTYHGIYNQKSRLKAFYNSIMARGEAIICNSEYTAATVRERHPAAAGRIGVIYRGVDTRLFNRAGVSPDRVRALREAWGIPHATRIILMPARLTRWKGQRVLIEAASQLRKRGELGDAVFVLVGDAQGRSAYRYELETLIKERGLGDSVILAGHCIDMPAAFKAASLTVIASTEPEAFGRVSVEAQALGCPVVASNIGAMPEVMAFEGDALAALGEISFLSPGQKAVAASPLLYEPGNPEALCAAIHTIMAIPEEALEPLRQKAMDRIKRDYSTFSLQKRTLSLYDRLIGTQLATAFIESVGG